MGIMVYNNPDDNWRHKDSQDDWFAYSFRTSVYALIGIIAAVLLLCLLFGCGTMGKALHEETNVQDSVRIETIERVVKVPVVVTVEVPAERQERITNDTVSVLETGFSLSTASLTWHENVPFLFHSLENKPQKIARQDTVPIVEKEVVKWKTRVEYRTVEKEKQLTRWQKVCINAGEISLAACMIVVLVLVIGVLFHRK